MFRHTEERWYKGYEIIMTMLGGKPSKKTSKKNKLKDDLLCQNKEDYANLTPQEKEELNAKMENKYKDSIAQLFGGIAGQLGVF